MTIIASNTVIPGPAKSKENELPFSSSEKIRDGGLEKLIQKIKKPSQDIFCVGREIGSGHIKHFPRLLEKILMTPLNETIHFEFESGKITKTIKKEKTVLITDHQKETIKKSIFAIKKELHSFFMKDGLYMIGVEMQRFLLISSFIDMFSVCECEQFHANKVELLKAYQNFYTDFKKEHFGTVGKKPALK